MSENDWDLVVRVHLKQCYNLLRHAWPVFRQQAYGRVVMATSSSGLVGNFGQANYGAAKDGIAGMTRVIARELGRYGITANALCPVWVETDMVHTAVANIVDKTGRSADDARAGLLALAGQPRMLTPDDVAAAALRLLEPDGAAVNGQAILIE